MMKKSQITLENLPAAVFELSKKIDVINRRLSAALQPEPKPEYLSVEKTAELLQLANRTIYNKVYRGELPYIKTGKKLLFKRTDLENYLENSRNLTEEEVETQARIDAQEIIRESVIRRT